MKTQTVIFMVRHGQTDTVYVADERLDDVRVLTEEGRAQLQKVGEYLAAFMPKVIFTSPRQRTVESAEIIQQFAQAKEGIIQDKALYEIYTASQFAETAVDLPAWLRNVASKYAGEQVVCVSHQDAIEQALRGLGVSSDEAQFPCQMAAVYRLVFAGDTFVECSKLNPANT